MWEDKQLQEMLLALPLPAAELLLSSDQLRVVSEDTVLYTALPLILHNDSIQGRQAAKEALSKCIRCAHLSQYNLLAHATATDSPLFDVGQQKLLLGMLSLRLAPTQGSLEKRFGDRRLALMPKAWLLPPRAHLVPPSPASLTWKVPVADLKDGCMRAASSRETLCMSSSSVTGVLFGTTYKLRLDMEYHDDPAGVEVALYVGSEHSYEAFLCLKFCATVVGLGISRHLDVIWEGWTGWGDFFDLGCMGGDGWDEAAWAAKGLPLEGRLELQLTVEPL